MNPIAFLPKRRKVPSVNADSTADGFDGQRALRSRVLVSRKVGRLLVLVCIMLSVGLSEYASRFEHLNAKHEFAKITVEGVDRIRSQIGDYAQVLTGTGAYIAASEGLDPDAFERFVTGLDLEENFPGLMGIGFVEPVASADLPAMEKALSSQYGTEIRVHPKTPHDEKLVVTRMAPYAENGGVIGLDTSFEQGRRAAYQFARETGQTALTPRVELVQDQAQQIGFLIVRSIHSPQSNQAQPERFLGWAVAPFVGSGPLTNMQDEVGRNYNLTIFEGTQAQSSNILFASDPSNLSAGKVKRQYEIDLYGREWLLSFVSTPAFDVSYTSYLSEVLLVAGLTFSVLLWMALRSTALRSSALRTVAEQRGRQLDARADENRALLETNVLAVLTLDAKSQIAFANSAAEKLFGYPQGALIQLPFADVVTLNPNTEATDTANAIGRAVDGNTLSLDVQANTWRTADDAAQTTVLIRDVSEQIDSQNAIEALHRRYNVALSGAGIGIYEVDVVNGKAEMSATWHRIMETDKLRVPFDHHQHFLARVHPDDLSGLLEADHKCISGESNRSEAEYRVRFKDGWRWMFSDGVPVARGTDGRATRLIGTQMDITDLRHARNALELSEARFRVVLEDAPVGMAVMDEKGVFTGVNGALAKLSGYDAKTLKADMRLADLLSRKDFVRMSHDIRSLLKSGISKTYQNQFRVRTRSGELRWGLFNFSWTYDKNRDENVYIAQIIDISDQKRIEKIKSEFVATVSHELRTPLTSIKGALGIMNVTCANTLPDGAQRLLDIASVNADRLTGMVNDILDLEKLTSGDIQFEFADTELNDLIDHTIAAAQPLAADNKNVLTFSGDVDDTTVCVDAGRFRQVLMILLSNACKFSDPETDVVVRIEVRNEHAIVFVENVGPAVPESFGAKIFDAFTQVDGSDTRSKGGTGLGLNIARQIVQRLGGRIGFESLADRQTVFWFTCPLAITAQGIVDMDALIDTPNHATLPRILIVDANSDFFHLLSRRFERLVDLVHVSSITDAQTTVLSEAFEGILLDETLMNDDVPVLLNVLQQQNPVVTCVGLTENGGAHISDARICQYFTKSEASVDDIIESVLSAFQEEPEKLRKAMM